MNDQKYQCLDKIFSFLQDSLLVAFHASVLFSILFILYEIHLWMSPQKQILRTADI